MTLLVKVCAKGHRSMFRSCPICAAEKRTPRTAKQVSEDEKAKGRHAGRCRITQNLESRVAEGRLI